MPETNLYVALNVAEISRKTEGYPPDMVDSTLTAGGYPLKGFVSADSLQHGVLPGIIAERGITKNLTILAVRRVVRKVGRRNQQDPTCCGHPR